MSTPENNRTPEQQAQFEGTKENLDNQGNVAKAAEKRTVEAGLRMGVVLKKMPRREEGFTGNLAAVGKVLEKGMPKNMENTSVEASKEATPKKAPETHSERLQQTLDEGIQKLKQAKTPAETMGALMLVMSSMVEFVQRTFNGKLSEPLANAVPAVETAKTTETALTAVDKQLAESAQKNKDQDPIKDVVSLTKEKNDTVTKNTNSLKTLGADVEKAKTEKNGLTDKKATIEKQITNLGSNEDKKEEVTSLRTQLEAVEKQIEAMSVAIKKLDEQIARLTEANKRLKAEVKVLDERASALNLIKEVLQTLNATLKKIASSVTVTSAVRNGEQVLTIDGLTPEQKQRIDPNAAGDAGDQLVIQAKNPPASLTSIAAGVQSAGKGIDANGNKRRTV